jgi:hypothetical protein
MRGVVTCSEQAVEKDGLAKGCGLGGQRSSIPRSEFMAFPSIILLPYGETFKEEERLAGD